MSKAHAAHGEESASNGDAVAIKIGGALVRKLLPWLIGGGVLGGGGYVKIQHDSEIETLKAGQAAQAQKLDRLDGKMDLVVDLLRSQRNHR